MHQADVLFGPADHLVEAIDRVGLDQRLSHHKLNRLARLVKIHLAKELKAPVEYEINIVVNLAIVDDFVIDD